MNSIPKVALKSLSFQRDLADDNNFHKELLF